MSASPPPLIGSEQAALMARRVSVIVGSRDAQHRPHVMRAVGCRVSPDRRRISVFLIASSSQAVLADLRENGLIAVVFSEPTTHRTAQFKGSDAVVAPLEPGDADTVADYLQRFIAEIGQIGFTAEVARTMLGHAPDDLVAVHFTPSAGFEQTPGPTAGDAFGPPTGAGLR
jgi:hypothetical protein